MPCTLFALHSSPTLFAHTLRPHSSPTLFAHTLRPHSSPTLFKARGEGLHSPADRRGSGVRLVRSLLMLEAPRRTHSLWPCIGSTYSIKPRWAPTDSSVRLVHPTGSASTPLGKMCRMSAALLVASTRTNGDPFMIEECFGRRVLGHQRLPLRQTPPSEKHQPSTLHLRNISHRLSI